MERRWKLAKDSAMTGDIFRMRVGERHRLKHWNVKQMESNKCSNSMTTTGIKGQGQVGGSCTPGKQN